jgi:hypothetical protein
MRMEKVVSAQIRLVFVSFLPRAVRRAAQRWCATCPEVFGWRTAYEKRLRVNQRVSPAPLIELM